MLKTQEKKILVYLLRGKKTKHHISKEGETEKHSLRTQSKGTVPTRFWNVIIELYNISPLPHFIKLITSSIGLP